jgi:hypothetical protein
MTLLINDGPSTGGQSVRALTKGGAETQVVTLDLGGAGAEALLSGSIPVTGTFFQATQPVSIASMPSTPVTGTFWQATQPVSFTWAGLTNAELRATAVPVSLTSTEISNFPATQAVTGTFWQATQPVSGTFWQATQPVSFAWAGLTDTELRANPVPVSGPLTDTQLRALPVDIEPAPALLSSYTQAGVITINTVLLTLDCSQHRSVSVQCVSMGTTGVVTPEWSNNNSTWIAATMFTAAGASAATFNAAGLWRLPVMARYLRLRLSTATTAGTTTLEVHRFESELSPWLATQPVSGTVALGAGTALVGDVGMQVRANATGAMTGHHIVAAGSTNVAQIKATAGRVYGWCLSNTTASWRYVKLHNVASATAGAAVAQTIGIPPNDKAVCSFPHGIAFATAISRSIVTGSADADATAVTAGDVVGDIFFA